MKTSYRAKSIANYFLSKGDLSPMKLQKLIYFAHGWCLALHESPLINEEIEAWDFGPVIPSLYQEFKEFGNRPIDRKASDIGFQGNRVIFRDIAPPSEPNTIAFLDKIWEVYGGHSAIELSNMTHEQGTPWDKTVKESKNKYGYLLRNLGINNELIADSFKKKLK